MPLAKHLLNFAANSGPGETTVIRKIVSPLKRGIMRSTIKIFLALTMMLWAVAILFPLTTYPLGFYGGITASMAGICAVIDSYRAQEFVWTRGGKVYEKDSKIGYLVPHMVLSFFLASIALIFLLASIFGPR